MNPTLRLLRPHQYAKNLLVFAAPGAAGRLGEAAVASDALVAFGVFCAVSSAGYVVNDLADAEADRRHPVKRHRPIASGAVSPPNARRLAVGLAGPAVVVGLWLGGSFTAALLAYAATTLLYSLAMKTRPWIELALLSMGFVLRALAGGAATDTAASAWFVVVVWAGAFALVTGKRLSEMVAVGADAETRAVLRYYAMPHLRVAAVVAASVAVVGYLAWAATEAAHQSVTAAGVIWLRLTVVPFVVAMARFVALAQVGRGEAPDTLVFRDSVLGAAAFAWALLYAIGLYA